MNVFLKLLMLSPMLAAIALNTALAQSRPPPLPQELPEELSQQFSNDVADEIVVLSPEMIRFLRDAMDAAERAESQRYDFAEPRISTEVISNRPGEQIRELYVGTNFNANIIFRDEAGAPWPVVYHNVGNASAYRLNEINEHTFEVEVLEPNTFSNITFMLDGHDGPIMINVSPPEHYLDYTKTYTVQGISPSTASSHRSAAARAQRSMDRPSSTDGLAKFLDGVPPADALTVAVLRGSPVDMWVWNERLIIRTQKRLMSPASDAEPLYGPNGWRVYAVRNPSSILTFVHNGQTQMTHISESAIRELRQ